MASEIDNRVFEALPKPKRTSKSKVDWKWVKFRHQYLDKVELHNGMIICVDCKAWKSRDNIELHHLIKRSQSKAKKYDEDNVVELCYRCHAKREKRL
jgi:5-methylcytosine-specific restriction endonuclease McrA